MSGGQKASIFLQQIHAFTTDLERTVNLEDLYEASLDVLQQAPDVAGTGILTLDPYNLLRFRACRGLAENFCQTNDGYSLWAPGEPDPQALVLPDLEGDERLNGLRSLALDSGIRALALIPLKSPRRVLGAVMLCYESPHRPGDMELHFLETVAAHIASSINAHLLVREIEDAREWIAKGIESRPEALDGTAQHEYAEQRLHEEAAFLTLLQRVTVAANEAEAVEDAFQFTLDILCDYTGWPIGHVYVTSPDDPLLLEPLDRWHLEDPLQFARFRRVTQHRSFVYGEGLPGRVLIDGKPAWIEDVAQDENFPRARFARDLGARAAFAFPVMVGKEIAAVFEFFAREVAEPDEALLELVAHIGTQLGRVVERTRAAQAVQQSELRFRSVVESALHAIVLADDQGCIVGWNKSARSIFGYTEDEVIGEELTILMPERYREAHQRSLDHFTRTNEPRAIGRILELEGLRRDGTEFPLELSLTSWMTEEGRFYGGMIQDITARRQSENTIRSLLQLSERLNATLDLQTLLETLLVESVELVNARGGIAVIRTLDGSCIGWSYRHRQLRPLGSVSSVEPILDWLSAHKEPFRTDDLTSTDYPVAALHAEEDITSLVSVPLRTDSDELVGFFEVHNKRGDTRLSGADQEKLMAVSEIASIAVQNAQLVNQLRTTGDRLRDLGRKVVTAQEEERQRLSRELHDSAAQLLTTLIISLSILETELAEVSPRLHEQVTSAKELASSAYEEIRAVSHALRPPALEMVGLNKTLEALCRDFARQIQVEIKYDGMELPPLSDQVSISFYRFLQETLANVAKHARATRVQVELSLVDNELALTVQDNGVGFTLAPGTIDGRNRRGGVGLLGLKERFELLNGEVTVTSHPEQGTRVMARCEIAELGEVQ